jgi:polyisoprenoid-binding protein YceI
MAIPASTIRHRDEKEIPMTDSTMVEMPGLVAGTWEIDSVHSEVSFVVRHMVVSKVRGRFDRFSGTIVTDQDLACSSVTVTIDASSINTNEPNRDNHVRSADFLDVEHFPDITFRSTAVRTEGSAFFVDGELTIRGTTGRVTLDVEVNGFTPDPYGGTRAGFSARTEINRQDFGVSYNGPIPGAKNAMVLSDKVDLTLEVEGVLQGGESVA